MEIKKVFFKNSSGHQLAGELELPVGGKVSAYAIFAHCFTCTKNLIAVKYISQALSRANIALLRFDFMGLGESQGEFSESNFSQNVSDLTAAARFLTDNYAAPQLMIGHSLGGPAVIRAASELPDVRAVVTIGSPCEPRHLLKLFEELREEIMTSGEVETTISGRPFTITRDFLEDLESVEMEEVIGNLKRPLLVCHAPNDQIVEIEQAAKIYAAARHPKSFISLDRADHLLKRKSDAGYVGGVIAAWAERYLELPENSSSELPDGKQWVVVRSQNQKLLTEINANGHRLVADEPIRMGGSNQGASPYEYLSAALGACTAMTLQLYASRKKLPLRSVTVYLKHQKIHAADCKDCETKQNYLDVIEREIELEGELTDEQRGRMVQIAELCPVHKTLSGSVRIETRLKLSDKK